MKQLGSLNLMFHEFRLFVMFENVLFEIEWMRVVLSTDFTSVSFSLLDMLEVLRLQAWVGHLRVSREIPFKCEQLLALVALKFWRLNFRLLPHHVEQAIILRGSIVNIRNYLLWVLHFCFHSLLCLNYLRFTHGSLIKESHFRRHLECLLFWKIAISLHHQIVPHELQIQASFRYSQETLCIV